MRLDLPQAQCIPADKRRTVSSKHCRMLCRHSRLMPVHGKAPVDSEWIDVCKPAVSDPVTQPETPLQQRPRRQLGRTGWQRPAAIVLVTLQSSRGRALQTKPPHRAGKLPKPNYLEQLALNTQLIAFAVILGPVSGPGGGGTAVGRWASYPGFSPDSAEHCDSPRRRVNARRPGQGRGYMAR